MRGYPEQAAAATVAVRPGIGHWASGYTGLMERSYFMRVARPQRNWAVQIFAVVGLCLGLAACLPSAHAAPNLKDGAFSGQVVDSAGKPVAGARVAVLDRKNNVESWSTTNADGRYTVAAPLDLLQLPTKRHRGLLANIGRGFVQVVSLPVQAVGAAVGVVQDLDPIGTLKSAVVSTATGSPVPLATQATTDLKNLAGNSEQNARSRAAQTVVNGKSDSAPKKAAGSGPGEVTLVVSAPEQKVFRGVAGAYWVQPKVKTKASQRGPEAWLDTVKLAPAADAKAVSATVDQAVKLSDLTVAPVMPIIGAPVHLSVKVQSPAEPPAKVRVFAREQKTGSVTELLPQADGVYAGVLKLDPKMSAGNTTVTIAALNPAAAGPREKDKPDPLPKFASNLDDMNADKPYVFDPRQTLSDNRLDLKLTVLDPSRETPPAPAPAKPPAEAPTPPAAAAPAPKSAAPPAAPPAAAPAPKATAPAAVAPAAAPPKEPAAAPAAPAAPAAAAPAAPKPAAAPAK